MPSLTQLPFREHCNSIFNKRLLVLSRTGVRPRSGRTHVSFGVYFLDGSLAFAGSPDLPRRGAFRRGSSRCGELQELL